MLCYDMSCLLYIFIFVCVCVCVIKASAITKHWGEIDLSSRNQFRALANKYEKIAVGLMNQIESHHLAGLYDKTQTQKQKQ